jgi:hypothetical protein
MSPPNPPSERLRFAEFTLDRLANGRCRARVGLTWKESETRRREMKALRQAELRVGPGLPIAPARRWRATGLERSAQKCGVDAMHVIARQVAHREAAAVSRVGPI